MLSGEPGVDVGLTTGFEVDASVIEVREESLGCADLLSTPVGDGGAELAVPVGSCSGDDVPAGVAGQELALVGVLDVGQQCGRPAVEPGGLFVAFGEDVGGDEERAEVVDQEPVALGIEDLVGNVPLFTDEFGKQVQGDGGVPVAQDRAWSRSADQRVADGLERR